MYAYPARISLVSRHLGANIRPPGIERGNMEEPFSANTTRLRGILGYAERREGGFEYVASVLVRSYIHRMGVL